MQIVIGGGGLNRKEQKWLYALTMVYAMVDADICEIVNFIHPLHSPYINSATQKYKTR
jgi:hypothetical protein